MRQAITTAFGSLWVSAFLMSGCATIPEEPEVKWVSFPKEAHLGVPDKPFHKLGLVRTKVAYSTLQFDIEEQKLCQNAFNKAAIDLVKRAREVGADAVIDMKSVVFQLDGKTQTFDSAECVDDGAEGQVLAQGVAVRWARAGELIQRRRAGLPIRKAKEPVIYAPKSGARTTPSASPKNQR